MSEAIMQLPTLAAKAIKRFGHEAQIRQTAEECAELGAECLRYIRGRTDRLDHLYDEAADVHIMVLQLIAMDKARFALALERKAEHLRELLMEPTA